MGQGISLASLKIRTESSGKLETALRALQQGNVYVWLLQETKLT